QVGAALLEGGERRLAAGARLALVAGAAQRRGDHLRHALLVVDDEDARGHAAAGRRSVKRAPPPVRSPTSIRPPCASTIWRATARPRPVPRGRVVKKGSKMRAGEGEERVDDVPQAVDLRGDEGVRPAPLLVVARYRLGEPLRRGADDGERAPHLVRDGGRELAERGELLRLGEAGAGGGDRLALRADHLGLTAVAPPALDDVAGEEAEEGERGAEPYAHQRADVVAV